MTSRASASILLLAVIAAGCDHGEDAPLALVSVSEDVLTMPSPAGHQLESVALDDQGHVFVGSLDGGLSMLDLHSGRFHLLTPQIRQFGTEVEKVVFDPERKGLWLKVGYGQGRLVYLPLDGPASLVPPPMYASNDHTRFDQLDVREPDRRWMEDFTLSPDGEIWAVKQEAPAGMFAWLNTPRARFVPAQDPLSAPELMATDPTGFVWAVSGESATSYESASALVHQEIHGNPVGPVPTLHPQESAYHWNLRRAQYFDGKIWVASPTGFLVSSGERLVPHPTLGQIGPDGYGDLLADGERLWLQLDERLLTVRTDSPRAQALPSGYADDQAAARMLGIGHGRSIWFGTAHELVGFDPVTDTPRRFAQPTMMPSPRPRYRPPGVNDRWRHDPDHGPQSILTTVAGELLGMSGAAPARYNAETGLWDTSLPLSSAVKGHGIVATVSTFDGVPVVLLETGVVRWEPELGGFGRPIALLHLVDPGDRLDIAIDQNRGIVVLSCDTEDREFSVESCRMTGYLPWVSPTAVPLLPSAEPCIHLIEDGLEGWRTSSRQAMLTCSPQIFLGNEPLLVLPGSLRDTLQEALLRFVLPQTAEFMPVTALSANPTVAWGTIRNRPALWHVGEPVRVLDGGPPLDPADVRHHERFAVDHAGNLCMLTSQPGAAEAEVRCINAFGSEVARWRDDKGLLGSLKQARLRAAPSGQLWIDGLRGRVAWLTITDDEFHVVRVDRDSDAGPIYTRPLTRIMGFHHGKFAWVEASSDVFEVAPSLTPYGQSSAPVIVSARRLFERNRWPMAPIELEGSAQLVMSLPQEIFLVRLGTGVEKTTLTAQAVHAEGNRDIGPNVSFVEPGNRPGEVWVGLREGGVLHYRPGRTMVRYSTRAGIELPRILGLTTIGDGAVAATPDGLYWLDDRGPNEVHAIPLRLPRLSAPIVAIEALDDGPGVPGSPLFIAMADRTIHVVHLPVEAPRPVSVAGDAGLDGLATLHTRLAPSSALATVELTRLTDVVPTEMIAIPADQSSSGFDELLVGTNNGLKLIRRTGDDWSHLDVRHVMRQVAVPTTGEVTALAGVGDGRVAVAYWNEVESQVLLHDTSSLETWLVRLKEPTSKVYALSPLHGPTGAVFLAVRQSSSLALSAVPVLEVETAPIWPWATGAGGLLVLLGVAGLVALRRRNPWMDRLRADPEAVREIDLGALGEIDRHLGRHKRPILAAAGIEGRRWERAIAVGDAWYEVTHPSQDQAVGLRLAEAIGDALDARIIEAVQVDVDGGDRLEVFRVELPRLPINLPALETTLIVLTEQRMKVLVPDLDSRRMEDLFGHVLRTVGQSMGTPFLLVTDLSQQAQVPSLVHARFPGLILRPPRLRELALNEQPRRGLSQLILTDCWLDAISPYKSSGPVEDPAMFVGRERERRELVAARSVSAIICGGRRVGKTSLIRQLVRDLGQERPEMTVHEISLLGIRSYTDFVDRLERRLGVSVILADAQQGADGAEDAAAEPASPALARIRRRRARRSNPTLSPDHTAAAIHEALEAWAVQLASPPLLILDEIDGIAARDAEAGYPLFSALHQLKSEGICSFLLVGFAELYRQTFDYDSPLYNFARVLQLGPLDLPAARRLVLEPMARLGVVLKSEAIAEQIVEATAAFPNLVQFICDMLLRQLSQNGKLELDIEDLAQVLDFSNAASQPLSAYVAESFDQNVGRMEEALVYTLLLHGPRPSGLSDIAENLGRLGIETDLAQRRAMVRRLKLVGVLKELPGEQFDLALPLLVQLLLAKDLHSALEALVIELGV